MPQQKRQLAAIMFTDIVGYTALMGSDEKKAFEVLRTNRNIHKTIIIKYQGKFLKEIGDGILACFNTATDAVRCAGAIQNQTKREDIVLRIGIHLGDVVFDGGDVLGDGVNVASRLEELAEAGSIYISGTIHNNVKNKDGISTEFIEEKTLKNVDEPVRVYSVECENAEFESFIEEKQKTSTNKMLYLILAGLLIILAVGLIWYKIPEQPIHEQEKSIAVLPFKNMSADADNLAFCDGQWEAILSHLSKIEELRVISRQSTEQYRDSKKTVPEIAKDLRISYLIEGSVQKFNDQVKITVQLINAAEDKHIWSKEYMKGLNDVFSLQKEVASGIASQFETTITEHSKSSGISMVGIDPRLYDIYLSGRHMDDLFHKSNLKDSMYNEEALRRQTEVVQRAPEFANAYVHLAWAYMHREYYRSERNLYDTAFILVNKALEIEPNNVDANRLLANYYDNSGDYDQASEYFNKVIELDPNDAYSNISLGFYYLLDKDFKMAIPLIFRAIRNNPSLYEDDFERRLNYYYIINELFLNAGMFEESLTIEKKIEILNPDFPPNRVGFQYILTEKYDEALPYYIKAYKNDTSNLFAISMLAQNYSYLKQWDKAEHYFRICLNEIYEKDEAIFSNMHSFLFRFGYVLWQQGKKGEAREMFEKHIKIVQGQIDNGSDYAGHLYDLACTYAFTGESKKALKLLQEIPFWYVTYGLAHIDPLLDPIRDDPEFQRIINNQGEEMFELRRLVLQEQYSDDLKWILRK